MIIYGINAVAEALRAGQVLGLRVSERAGERARDLARHAGDRGIRVQWVSADVLDRASGGAAHQGVVAELQAPKQFTLAEVLEAAEAAGPPLLLVLDGIEDPQNLGAVLRTADAAGVDAVIKQTRRSAPLGSAAAKASAGAIAHVRTVQVVNIAQTLTALKDRGIWTVGLAADAPARYFDIDLTQPSAVVVGAEGTGLRRLVRERCDWLASIPMRGRVASLNVSVAAGIALFEAVRQRAATAPVRQARKGTDRT